VFTPRGDVIDLPQGACPVDFAYRVHSDIGNSCTGARVNGRMVPLDYKLHNGDICEIIRSRSAPAGTTVRAGTIVGPKRGWLDFVVTPHAKNRIKSYLKKQNFEDNYREGLDRLEKAAQSERLKLGKIADNEKLLKHARALTFKTVPELIAAIGYGEHSAESILKRLRADLQEESKAAAEHDESLSGAASSILARRVKPRSEYSDGSPTPPEGLQLGPTGDGSSGQSGQLLDGGALLFSLARCCAPIPGDEVKGYITRGRGITVHRVDCPNLKHYEVREPDRLIQAHWTAAGDRVYQTLIAIEASDRVGLLHDITSVISEQRINIMAVNTYPLKDSRARLNLAVTIDDVDQLHRVMQALRGIEGINDVHRV
jgi:guanosine-3',5'-bis(diphosphate) 3'-pyrophosphohydrolase